jgi:hypothetical protein
MIDGKPPDVTVTDWKTVAGYPRLPIHPETKDVIWNTYQAPGTGTRLRLSMPTSASIAGAVNKVFSMVSRGASTAVRFVLARPVTLLMLGGAAAVLYHNWDALGWYFYKVMEILNWFKTGEAHADATRAGEQYLKQALPNASKALYNLTDATSGNVNSVQLTDSILSPQDHLNDLFELVKFNPQVKDKVQDVINATVASLNNGTDVPMDMNVPLPDPETKELDEWLQRSDLDDWMRAATQAGAAANQVYQGLRDIVMWGTSGNKVLEQGGDDFVSNVLS